MAKRHGSPQTVRAWIKSGLKTIDKGKTPTLIYGYHLITYIKAQNNKGKCKVAFDEMYCLKCQDARNVYQRNVTIKHKNGFLHLSGICRDCKKVMCKSYKMDALPEIRKTYHVVEVLELYDCATPTCKTHLPAYNITPINESKLGSPYGDLFE